MGYVILAIIVEKISGLTFQKFSKNNIFTPLNMSHTYIPNQEEANSDVNYVHDYWFAYGSKSYIEPDDYPELDNIRFTADAYGPSGICTNATDLYNFSKIFTEKPLLMIR